MSKKIFLACSIALILSACSSAPPKCADSEASDLVKQIVTGELNKFKAGLVSMHPANAKISYSVELKNIRTMEKNESTGGYSCAGTIDVESTNAFFKRSVDITYKTEITEDSKEPYITVYGFK